MRLVTLPAGLAATGASGLQQPTMYIFEDLRAAHRRKDAFAAADLLIAALSDTEVVLRNAIRADATVIFEHETIGMMRAERAAEVERLRRQLGPKSLVMPICKKDGSFWDEITLGRAPTNDMVIADPAVSNVHAHFEISTDREARIQDLGSSNGTFVNRTPLQPYLSTQLGSGDCLRFGQTVFYYVGLAMLDELLR